MAADGLCFFQGALYCWKNGVRVQIDRCFDFKRSKDTVPLVTNICLCQGHSILGPSTCYCQAESRDSECELKCQDNRLAAALL